MDSRSRLRHFAHAALVSAAALAAAPAVADRVLLGSDYLATMAPTFLGLTALAGMPIGPGNTDTIVQRLRDCTLDLGTIGSSCTIPIEMVALSLVGGGGMVRVRE